MILARMFCPNCKTEYRPGFSRCSDCGADLVERLESSAASQSEAAAGPELLWTGTDSAAYGLIVDALDDAEIPHHESSREAGPLPGLSQPVYAIFIPSRHREAGRAAMEKAVGELLDGSPQPVGRALGAPSAAADLVFIDDKEQDDDDGSAPDDIVENFDPDLATSEVWSGGDADLKDMLVACLRENGIGCEVQANGKVRILVMPESEARAREIIREVLDASAPE